MHSIDEASQMLALVGQELGVSDWLEVSQEQIDQFAAATGDRQWIHCDQQRAARESPYGATIAHGFLTLSLCVKLAEQIVAFEGARLVVNYGLNRVRFPSPVKSGSNLRLSLKLLQARQLADSLELGYQCTLEVQGQAKPACIAEWLLRVYF